ncbi:MAG TPA: hypothetical protein VLG50_05550 [Candidatus Saccharimonadales bacterium]|nr:hypothetical protein [Candidatus Saccharimonadales bacterium]
MMFSPIPIMGFVVNTYDALNYDIDFPFVDIKLLDTVKSNEYHYKNIMKNGHLSSSLKGKSYRCRLNGIEINAHHYNRSQIKKYTNDVRKLFDRGDGWIECTLKGIDVFKRLLVDIIVLLPNDRIDLYKYILDKSNDDPSPPFNKYIKNSKFKNRNLKQNGYQN